MKTKRIWLSAATAAAIFASAWLGATPTAAQTDGGATAPAATPIPIDAPVDVPVKPVPMEATAASVTKPAAVQAVAWLPVSGFLRPDASRNVTVTALSALGLSADGASVVLYNSSNFPVRTLAATVAATSTVGGIDTFTLTASLPTTITFASFTFIIRESGDLRESAKYKVGYPNYLALAYRTYVFPPENLDLTEPSNSDKCTTRASLLPETTYNASFESSSDSDWSYVDVPTSNSSLLITATNVPTPSQMQIFVSTNGKCDGVLNPPTTYVADQANPSITVSGLTAGTRIYVRLVSLTAGTTSQRYTLRVSQNPTSGLLEDNDNPCQATFAQQDTTYTSYGDDNYDFFEMRVATTGTLSMTLGADVITQLDLRSSLIDANCSATASTRQLAYKFIVNNQAQIQYFVTPGTYYARMYVANVNIPNPARAYNFRWTLTAGSKVPKVCIGQDDSINDCSGDVPDPFWMKIKWEGLNGNARIRLTFTGNNGGGTGNCTAGAHPLIEFTVTDPSGVRLLNQDPNWQMPRGGYAVNIVALDATTSAQLYQNAQSLKVGCHFRPAAQQALPEVMP